MDSVRHALFAKVVKRAEPDIALFLALRALSPVGFRHRRVERQTFATIVDDSRRLRS